MTFICSVRVMPWRYDDNAMWPIVSRRYRAGRAVIGPSSTTLNDSRRYIERIKRHGFDTQDGRKALSESNAFGVSALGDSSRFSTFTDMMLPAFVRGLASYTPSTRGSIFYGCDRDVDIPFTITSDEPQRSWGEDCYMDAFNTDSFNLANIAYDGHKVFIPLPATGIDRGFTLPPGDADSAQHMERIA